MSDAAFYCVSGSDFFLGTVALVNSLRLQGHAEPIHLLDCGLGEEQKRLLGDQVALLAAPSQAPPSLLKWIAPRVRSATTMFLIDTDMIVTRPLDDLFASAATGRLVAFENDRQRHFEQWAALLGLGRVRRGTYLSSAAVCLSAELDPGFLAAIEDGLARLDSERTWIGDGEEADPLFYADQDVLNAIVLARLEPEQVLALDPALAATPPFSGLRCADRLRLRCRYADGSEPYLLHHFARKPWLVSMRSNVYSRLMTRLLFADDVTVRVPAELVPTRLRAGLAGGAARFGVDLAIGVPAGIRRRLGAEQEIRAWPHARTGAETR